MKLNRGINLGGFLSQCVHTQEHYDSFILEEDIQNVAKLGFDHVRLPIDYMVFEQEDGTRIESGFERVDRFVGYSKKYGLDIILDLHKAYGYDFNDAGTEANSLFNNPAQQQRFIDLWDEISRRWGKEDHVAFELLNEVVEMENAQSWNRLIEKTVKTIRKNSSNYIIYGGICWNSVNTLKLLEQPLDKNIILTCHFYGPLLFTHQKAYWVSAMDPNQTVYYPATMDYYKQESKKLNLQDDCADEKLTEMGVEFMSELLTEAIKAANHFGHRLYVGEFGVIDQAPVEDTYRWFKDFNDVCNTNNMGWALWTYKLMDFGLIGEHYAPIREKLLDMWFEK